MSFSRMDCILITAAYAQKKIIAGEAHYGDVGLPNFQSIIELATMPDGMIENDSVQGPVITMKTAIEQLSQLGQSQIIAV